MPLEINKVFYCDYAAARGKDRAVEALDEPEAPDGAGVPQGWARITIERKIDNPEWSTRLKLLRKSMPEGVDEKEYIQSYLALNPDDGPILTVEDTLSLSPEAVPLLALIGYAEVNTDPATVMGAIAAALGTPSLPPASALTDLPEEKRQPTLDLIRATLAPFGAKDIERAILHACKGPLK